MSGQQPRLLRPTGGPESNGADSQDDATVVHDVAAYSVPDLLRLSRTVLGELKRRGVVRSDNAPAGDYGEYLVARAYNGTLAGRSTKSWDVQTAEKRTIQVKTRVLDKPAARSQFSPFRSFDFDVLILVLFRSSDMGVLKAVEMPASLLENHMRFNEHVRGSIISTSLVDLVHPDVVDITERLRLAARGL